MARPFYVAELTRREILNFLGLACAIGFASTPQGHTTSPLANIAWQPAARKELAFPEGAIIRTVLDDVVPDRLGTGPILFHEHLSVHCCSPEVTQGFTDDVDLMIAE